MTACSVIYELAFPCHYFRSLMRHGFTGSLKSVAEGLKVFLPQTCQALYKQLTLPPAAPTELFCFLVPFQVPCVLHSCSPPSSPTHPYRAQRATMGPLMLCLLSHLLHHSLSQDHCTFACVEPSALTVQGPSAPGPFLPLSASWGWALPSMVTAQSLPRCLFLPQPPGYRDKLKLL